MKKVGLLLPAYNEERNIQIIIKDAKKYLPGSKIVVVDDGSMDRTSELASGMGTTVLKHGKNMGKGNTLKTGFKYFLKNPVDFLIVTDTDGQYKIKDARKIVAALENNKGDVVSGYRTPSDMPYANRAGNFIWRTLFNLFFHTNLKDTNCGFIGFNRKALKKLRRVYGGYIIENSMLADCVKEKLKVVQVPVRVYYGKRKITKFARMFFGVLFFIFTSGVRHRLKRRDSFK